MLTDSATGGLLLMHAGDTITSGTIVLDSKVDGPLMPAFSVLKLGNSLGWGLVHDAPNAFVWEIGHTGNYTQPAGQYCLPGSSSAKKRPCYSFDGPSWLLFKPLQIKSVTFGSSGTPATSFDRLGHGRRGRDPRQLFRRADELRGLRRAVLHLPVLRLEREPERVHVRR